MNFLKKLSNLISEEIALIETASSEEYGTLYADAFELGNIVYTEDENPLFDATFEHNGFIYRTDEAGTIIDKTEKPVEVEEEVEMVTMVEATLEEGLVSAESWEVGKELFLNGENYPNADLVIDGTHLTSDEAGIINLVEPLPAPEVEEEEKEVVIELRKQLENITKLNETVILENTELKAKVEQLSKTPAVTKLRAEQSVEKNKKESSIEFFNRITK